MQSPTVTTRDMTFSQLRGEPAAVAAQGAEPKIKIRNLDFFYGSFQGLKHINLDIHEGMVTAFIGPSGCGKSTLLRTLNRMYDLYPGQRATGEILLNGRNVLDEGQDVNALRAKVGMVFQKPNRLSRCPFTTTSPTVPALHESLKKKSRAWTKSRGEERSAMPLSLWDEVKDKPERERQWALSGGQQQRLCIARGVAVKPEVLLLDEPTSALDPISTAKVEELVHELKSEYTIAIVTHNMQQAARVSDYTAYMYLGELVEFGLTDEIFIKPKRKETEDYITGRFG